MGNNNWNAYSASSVSYKGTDISEANTKNASLSKESGLTQAQVMERLYGDKKQDGSPTSQIEALIIQLVTQSHQDRATYYKLLQEFETYYLCNAIYDCLMEEVLRDSGDGVTINVVSEKYQDLCDEAMTKFNIPALVESMLPQFLHYGDYSYRVNKSYEDDEDRIGTITSISDDFSPGEVMGIYNNSSPVRYYRLPQVRNIRTTKSVSQVDIFSEATPISQSEVLHFTMKSNKVKLELEEAHREIFATPTLQVGIGVLWQVIDRLLLLKFREIGSTATDLSRLTRPTLVGASVPNSDSSDKVFDHCRKLESLLNTTSADISSMTGDFMSAITTAMSNGYKVIPQFASGRGDASKISLESQIDTSEDDRKTDNERRLICSMSGIPPEVVLSEDASGRGPSSQRIYARYNKMVKMIQRRISRPIEQFLVHYVATQTGDLEVSEKDIEVTMNSGTNIEDIDNAESLGYVIDNINNIIGAASSIQNAKILGVQAGDPDDPYKGSEGVSPINPERMMKYLRDEFKKCGSAALDIWLTEDEVKSLSGNVPPPPPPPPPTAPELEDVPNG